MNEKGLRPVAVNLAHYRGGGGQWAWLFHRLSGLGVLLFLLLHILDTSTVHFAPAEYDFFVKLYKNPIFGVLEIGLGAALIYHSLNGLKLVVLDFWPRMWEHQVAAQRLVWVLFTVIFVPMAGIMLMRIVNHYTTIAQR